MDGAAMDFGCGTGVLTMAIRDGLGELVVGVDTSRAMLEQFDRKAEGRGVTTVAVEVSRRELVPLNAGPLTLSTAGWVG